MEVTKPYKFIGFGAMEVTKPYKFIGFGVMEATLPKISAGARGAHVRLIWSASGARPGLKPTCALAF